MIALSGYRIIETIYENPKVVVYRAVEESEQNVVIIKLLKEDYSTFKDIAKFKHEYEIAQSLNLDGVVKTYRLEKYNSSIALILEDFGGQSLQSLLYSREIDLLTCLKIAVQLSKALGEIHEKNIIHKDIKPQNIILNPDTWQVKIADFSIASSLAKESQSVSNPNLLEGTLAYMSPEQTGRMNRSIDYRTDFYSLGVTFYELLTRQLPFMAADPLEMVHCHIAKQPTPPHEINSDIPQAVSEIVMKLLSKMAEERYQSAYGLKIDLEICLTQLQTTGRVENFAPGQQDVSAKFQIPQKLYGREAEIAVLMSAFDRVSEGGTEMMLVAGYSGIGKSALVNEIHKPIVRQRGYFISGKFDQFKRNIPYHSLIQAFQELVRQILTENEEQVQAWKTKILEALGPNGQVIVDVIPEVELIIGPQDPLPQLEASEAQNRFNLVFQKFLNVFTQKEHPLVLFLDDLQWADSASLKLLQLLMGVEEDQCLLVIGAYRDNEVSPTHPLMLTLESIQKSGAIIHAITLTSLSLADTNQLVADTLHCTLAKSSSLSELLLKKTNGNPFFLTQMLVTLYQEYLLTYNVSLGCWEWDLEQIQGMAITDNVVELMVSKIQKLSANTQDALKLAACIGNTFDLRFLAVVCEQSLAVTAAELWEALKTDLVVSLSNSYQMLPLEESDLEVAGVEDKVAVYRFLHDRVQQAAYSLIAEDYKKATHLKIGRLLLEHTPFREQEERIFDLVNQLNMGVELITEKSEKNQLAKLNLIAGQKAKAANAYESAVRYLAVGLELLPEDGWQNHYDLTFALHIGLLEAEYLNIHLEAAENLAETILKSTNNLLDKVRVYERKIQFYISQNQQLQAIATSLEILELIGEPLAQEPPTVTSIEDLIHLPEATDSYKLAALQILMLMMPAALYAKPDLLAPIAFTMVNLCIRYGNSAAAAYAYAFYGLLLCGGRGNIEIGYRFGQLGMQVLQKYYAKGLEGKVLNMFNVFVRHWKEPIRNTLEPLRQGSQTSFEVGDLEYGCYNTVSYCTYQIFAGEPLEALIQEQNKYIELVQKLKQEYQTYFLKIGQQLVLNLMGQSSNHCLLVGESFNETEVLPVLVAANNFTLLFYVYLAKTILCYLFKDYEQAIANAQKAAQYEGSMVGFVHVVQLNFYYSLALLALCAESEPEQQSQYLQQVDQNQERLQEWADHAPENYGHKYVLVTAEKLRVLGQAFEATEAYDRAIAGAKANGYVHEEALANELAAELYLSRNREKIAQVYLSDAYHSYIRWGATAKATDLEARHPRLLAHVTEPNHSTLSTNTKTSATVSETTGSLDLTSIVKASQAIAGEIVLSKLLNQLLKILMENAGAQTSCLILEKGGQLIVEATGNVDQEEIILWQSVPVTASRQVPASLINYVARTSEDVVLSNASQEGKFTRDPYIVKTSPKSVLCTPIVNKGKLIGLLYLENNLTIGAFTPDRLKVLRLLSAQAAISLENALLYGDLEAATENLQQANSQLEDYSRTLAQRVEERTLELKAKNQQLEHTLQELKQTQTQLIQTEKMSSLGQLVAGIAHEINNPVNFIHGNLSHTEQYTQSLLELIQTYQKHYPQPVPDIQEQIEDMDFEFLVQDLPKLLNSMQVGATRIRQIVLSLRNFSRLDESEMKPVSIEEGIESTLLILQHRLQRKSAAPNIQVVREYGELPQVECYAGQLNQVFMNILSNAIDSLDEYDSQRSPEEMHSHASAIQIRTELVNADWIRIRIADNGLGMTEATRQKLFDPFFTTKPVGSGTGLGLSISYQIVVEKHKGKLTCESAIGQGAEFIAEIPVRQLT